MKVVGKIFAVIVSIIYFFLLTGSMIAAFASNFVSNDYYTDILGSVDLSTIKVSDLSGLFGESQYDENATLEDVLIDFLSEGNIPDAKVKALLNDKEVQETIGNVIGEMVSYSLGGDRPQILKEDVRKFFNISSVKDVVGNVTEENIDYAYKEINKAIDEMEGGIDFGSINRNSESVEIHR